MLEKVRSEINIVILTTKQKQLVSNCLLYMCVVHVPQDAAVAAEKAAGLEQFKSARAVKINPDKPQENARFLTLEVGAAVVGYMCRACLVLLQFLIFLLSSHLYLWGSPFWVRCLCI